MGQGKGARFSPAMAPTFSLAWLVSTRSSGFTWAHPRLESAYFALRLSPPAGTTVLVECRVSVVSACRRCLRGARASAVPGRG